jgi:Ca2+-binding EF-hand superfamily protein
MPATLTAFRSFAPALLTLALTAPALAQEGRASGFLFDRIDADSNGEVSQDEIAAVRAQQFQRMDADGDDRVTLDELTAAQGRQAQRLAALAARDPAERLARQDSDGDGALTEAEFTAAPAFFTLIDADGNGAISRDEFDRARDLLSQ